MLMESNWTSKAEGAATQWTAALRPSMYVVCLSMALATTVPAEMKWAQACGIYILLASMHLLSVLAKIMTDIVPCCFWKSSTETQLQVVPASCLALVLNRSILCST
jgi:hypothetical protein